MKEVKDRKVQYPRRFKLTQVSGDVYDITPQPGTITEEGTKINKELFDGIKTDLDDKALKAHTHTKSDVGLSNVNNTSDTNKPISTATQEALNLKADLKNPTFTGTPKAPTPTSSDNSTQVATTAFVKNQGYITSGGYITLSSYQVIDSSYGTLYYYKQGNQVFIIYRNKGLSSGFSGTLPSGYRPPIDLRFAVYSDTNATRYLSISSDGSVNSSVGSTLFESFTYLAAA